MKNLQKVIENYILAYNQFDIEGMIMDLHEDVVFENISEGILTLRTEGIDEFHTQAEKAMNCFSQREQIIRNWDIQVDKVVIDIDYKATLATDLPNGMKQGDILQISGQSEFVFEEDNIIRIVDRA
ncbi:nuclear transport factor 2 family protein [Marinifilum sp. D714]|uniref:nuclear transport factor 2 family protein n=1 Tax=Marinifilum sp. D714 TaxID=2937523 RepID=UPI0027D0FD50|nr:nuclear transport factor 2 family protein [Marinifilum sp. D714]MDQ2180005.1 nuclear transport factor 2 family protein [Marinifilum sp. D714]